MNICTFKLCRYTVFYTCQHPTFEYVEKKNSYVSLDGLHLKCLSLALAINYI